MKQTKGRLKGISAALASAVLLGVVPVFGKQAMLVGFAPLAVVAIRTSIAALLLLLLMAIFQRPFFYIYPVGLAGCVLAGFVNGLGSILYYTALSRLDAGIGQLLYSFYPLFVVFWLMLDRQPISFLTALRLGLSIPGVYLLLSTSANKIDLLGAGFMLTAAALYALHLIINQRVLFEVPAQTVTLYTLLSMAGTVLIAYLIFSRQIPPAEAPWWPVLGMAAITFFSRLTLFLGIKHLGGLQTALLGLGEVMITVWVAHWWLKESLTPAQWGGTVLICIALILVGFDRYPPTKRRSTGLLAWLNPPQIPTSDVPWQSQP